MLLVLGTGAGATPPRPRHGAPPPTPRPRAQPRGLRLDLRPGLRAAWPPQCPGCRSARRSMTSRPRRMGSWPSERETPSGDYLQKMKQYMYIYLQLFGSSLRIRFGIDFGLRLVNSGRHIHIHIYTLISKLNSSHFLCLSVVDKISPFTSKDKTTLLCSLELQLIS